MRLKFMYPGGAVEILDCKWVAIVGLGVEGSETTSPWVVIEFEGRKIWKPLAYLVQAEVLAEHEQVSVAPGRIPARPREDLGYHR